MIYFSTFSGSQSTRSSTTTLKTIDDDIAHLTCTSRDDPVPSVRWEKDGKKLGDQSPGVAIISWNNGTVVDSHLFIAVTGAERRGKYTCVTESSKDGETQKTFFIEGGKATEGINSFYN